MLASNRCGAQMAGRMHSSAQAFPGRTALLGVDGARWTYAEVWDEIGCIVRLLRDAGVGTGDRVATVLPSGPAAAIGFLGVSTCAAAAPLNPYLSLDEYRSVLGDLSPALLLTVAEFGGSARTAADEIGLKVVELPFTDAPLSARDGLVGGSPRGLPSPDDVALILYTSGTTSTPKRVPLTQAQLAASAENVAATLALTKSDRCLNVMPLFHIHGIVAGLLASLVAGGSVVCAPGFKGEHFLDWLADLRPTWYTAVPTIHQSLLSEMDLRGMETDRRHALRFIRSSSSAMPLDVIVELEQRMNVPVIEAYGMTEATHQIASNPLPPAPRKPGSVGPAVGVEAVVLDRSGRPQPAGVHGELALRGSTICSGYENNDEANTSSFCGGWFRTGDEGTIDEDGYLFLTGRSKEMINRGGEKITPAEIDNALLEHPAVGQAVAFAVPHPTLGEDVAAAIVLKRGAKADEGMLRAHLLEHISEHKVPSRIVFVEAIPTGPSGKLQRIGLADKLKRQLLPDYSEPRTPFEKELAKIWEAVLGVERVGREDNFFLLGGDSLKAVRALSRVRDAFGAGMDVRVAFQHPVLHEHAAMILSTLIHREGGTA